MNEHEDSGSGSGYEALPERRRHAAARRDAGRTRLRGISAWTAAAFIAATAAGAGYFAHAGVPSSGTGGQVSTGTAQGAGHGPSLKHPVATSGGSGVTAGSAPASSGGSSGAATFRDN